MVSTFRPAGAYVLGVWRFYKHIAPLGLAFWFLCVYFSVSWFLYRTPGKIRDALKIGIILTETVQTLVKVYH